MGMEAMSHGHKDLDTLKLMEKVSHTSAPIFCTLCGRSLYSTHFIIFFVLTYHRQIFMRGSRKAR
jgi:hypothetical protein